MDDRSLSNVKTSFPGASGAVNEVKEKHKDICIRLKHVGLDYKKIKNLPLEKECTIGNMTVNYLVNGEIGYIEFDIATETINDLTAVRIYMESLGFKIEPFDKNPRSRMEAWYLSYKNPNIHIDLICVRDFYRKLHITSKSYTEVKETYSSDNIH